MSIYIYHGTSLAHSRQQLASALDAAKQAGQSVITLAGDKLLPQDLEANLGSSSLFGDSVVVIENLLSRLRSHDKDHCLRLLAEYSGSKNIYLWDKKEVTKAVLAKLPGAKVSLAKTPTVLFSLLDNLYPHNSVRALNLLHQVVPTTEDIVVFSLIARQISSLIQIVGGGSLKTSPWQLTKLQTIAKRWSLPQLIHFHDELVRIDQAIKSGRTKLSYLDHLDILLHSLLG